MAKVTTIHDPLLNRDYIAGPVAWSGLQDLLNLGRAGGVSLYDQQAGPLVSIIFDFK